MKLCMRKEKERRVKKAKAKRYREKAVAFVCEASIVGMLEKIRKQSEGFESFKRDEIHTCEETPVALDCRNADRFQKKPSRVRCI